MRTLYIDCRSGASGDMMLGAFLSLGVPLDALEGGLAALGLDEFHLEVRETVSEDGDKVSDVSVVLKNKENVFIDPYSGRFRNYGDIKRIINDSNITSTTKELSRRIFDIKAAAEALAHRVSMDEVQFHEAGAADSIVDIIGTAICFDYLDVDRVVSTPVPTGYGTVRCAFGELPVPAPATKAILVDRRVPYYRSDIAQELLTPTGAAILAGIVDEFVAFDTDRASEIDFATEYIGEYNRSGQGTGKRKTGLPPLKLYLIENDK